MKSWREGGRILLTAYAALCMAVCAGLALRWLIAAAAFIFVPHLRLLGMLDFVRYVCFQICNAIILALLAVCCAMTAFKRNSRNSDGFLVCLGGCGLAYVAVRFLEMLLSTILYLRGFPEYCKGFLTSVLGMALLTGGVYLIERYVMGETPLEGKNMDDLKRDVQEAFSSLQQAARETRDRQARQTQYNHQYNQYHNQYQPPYGQPTPPNGGGYAPFRLKADRSLAAYILLSFITCGLYSWYFIYALARDVNVACAGDGKTTAGLVKLLLLSFVTCGFYAFYWYYSLGNRLAENAPRYGMTFQENGTTVLLWHLVGLLACGLGPFVAWYIIIKNANILCGAYNYQHGI